MGMFERVAKFGASFFEAGSKTSLGKIVAPLETHSKEQYSKLAKMMGQPGASSKFADIGYNYFQGRNIKSIGEAIEYTDPNIALANKRKIIAGTAFGLAAANAMDFNPGGITDTATTTAAFGGHYFAGRTLMGMGGRARVAGIGYLAATAVNTLRSGDNLGPM
jgi:urease beta subunit